MPRSTSAFGVFALLASASASHIGVRRSTHAQHARHAAAVTKRDDTVVSGITYYGFQNNTDGACGTLSADTDMIAGIGPQYYGDMNAVSDNCFKHITVTLANDPTKSVDLTVTDACADCGEPGDIYVSVAAFQALNEGSLDAGILNITWTFNSGSGSSSSGSGSSSSSSGSGSSSSSSDGSSGSGSSDSGSGSDASSGSGDNDSSPGSGDNDSGSGSGDDGSASTTSQVLVISTPTTTEQATSTVKATTTSSKTATSAKSSPTGSVDGYKLSQTLKGDSFIDFFNFVQGTGDNGGVADYVDGTDAGLVYKSGNQVVLAVETTENVAVRKSVRMESKTSFNAVDNALFIFDIAHMPSVCGTWPAVWFAGPNWPQGGEIDIVEGINLYTQNVYSIHTGPGCTISPEAVSAMNQSSLIEVTGTSCDALVDQGACGFSDNLDTSFGPGFNQNGGGVYALEFNPAGTKIWFFPAGSVPSDIASSAPSPSTWGTPKFDVPSTTCSTETFFNDLTMIINTDLAGSFPQALWGSDGSGGQAISCQTQTGLDSAAEFVQNNGGLFGVDAQWIFNGFYIYKKK